MAQTKKQAVVGLAFTDAGRQMVVILKDHPADLANLYNGLGGGIDAEDKGNPQLAIAREAEEEANLQTHPNQWRYLFPIEKPNCILHVLYCNLEDVSALETKTSEPVSVMPVAEILQRSDMAPGVKDWVRIVQQNVNP